MKNLKIFLSFAFVICIFLTGLFLIRPPVKNLTPKNAEDIKYVKIAGKTLTADLALTPQTQAEGLSGRSGLADDEAMLFVFPESGNYPFWMKDMNFPIDMIWFDEDMKVIYIKKDARPELYPETYGPAADSKYVLEVVSGFADKNNLEIGDKAEFVY